MSIQRCEYEITTTRGDIQGEICTLTGRGCIITDLLQVDNCQRRLWAKQYQAKHPNPNQSLTEAYEANVILRSFGCFPHHN